MKYLTCAVFCTVIIMASGLRWKRLDSQKQVTPINNTKYEYKYGVKDLDTDDMKHQWEYRDGDQVKGGYSFKEADGYIRLVEYYVDGKSGFQAVVQRLDPSKYLDYYRDHHHEHITFNGHHVQHDAKGRAKSYVNIVHH